MSRETRCIDNQQPSFTEVKKVQRLGVMKKSPTSAQYLLQVNFGKENFVPYQNLQSNNISVNLYSDGKHFSINAKEEVSKFIHLLYDYDSSYGLPRKRALAMLHLYYCEHNR